MRSPIIYFGGKGRLSKKLLPLIPSHKTFVEVFGGGAALLFAKPPGGIEVYNDIDSDLYNLFLVLADPERFELFYRRVYATPYSRQVHNEARERRHQCKDPVNRAYWWFVCNRQSFSASRGWRYNRTGTTGNMSRGVYNWLAVIDRLPQIHERLRRVQIDCDLWEAIIDRYDTPDTFFYLDPPYVHETRSSTRYPHEMTETHHAELVERLLGISGKALLSCYYADVYEPLINAGWLRRDYRTVCYAAGCTRGTGILGEGASLEKQPRTETVLMNYETQLSLF